MKISNSANYINQTYINPANNAANQNTKSQKTADEAANGTKTDSINFSDRTQYLQKISKAMDSEPIDRKEYVADIKQKVETNQYNINAETIADKMVASLVDEIR